MVLRATARAQRWDQIKNLIKSSLFGKAKSPIGFGPFVSAVREYGGPPALQCHFANLITNKAGVCTSMLNGLFVL